MPASFQSSLPGWGTVAPAPVAVALAVLAAGCGDAGERHGPLVDVRDVPSPALPGSGEPNLHAGPDGRVHLTWFQDEGEGEYALLHSVLDGTPADSSDGPSSWGEPGTITRGGSYFVNWADFPVPFALSGDLLAVYWPARTGPGTFDYDVNVAWSRDGGETWDEPMVPHRDGTLSEHGFVSFFPWENGALGVVWLDGRNFAGWDEEAGTVVNDGERPDDPEMTLRFAPFTPEGPGPEVLLDDRICDCCQTSAAVTSEGPVVVYRDRDPDEVRDISIVRYADGSWSDPAPVHRDGWVIPACPVNGPVVAAEGRRVAVAWFTHAGEVPRVRLAFSRDAGRSFDAPVRVDEGNPEGRVALVLLPDGTALVSWLERTGGERAALRVRKVEAEGTVGPAQTVTRSSAARASGFPRMTRVDDRILFAWTDTEGARQVRTLEARVRP